MLFNNPEGIGGVTSYIYTVTLDILKEYKPEHALAGCLSPYLTGSNFSKGIMTHRVYLRTSLSVVSKDVRNLELLWASQQSKVK